MSLILMGLLACSQQASEWGYLEEGQYILEDSHANVLRTFEMFGTDDDGLSWGFNLDGEVTPDGEEESCGHGDLNDQEGRAGIDNQMAKIWDIIEPVAGVTAQGALQSSINEGRFLIMLEIVGATDFQNAEGVTLNIFQGDAKPVIGTYNLITPSQTYFIDTASDFVSVENLNIVDGVLEAGPVDFTIPVDILELQTTTKIHKGHFRFEINEDGSFVGFMGGAVSVSEFMYDLSQTDAQEEAALVEPLFKNNADMGYDGDECDLFSMAFQFEGTKAFVIREETEE